MFNGDFEDFEEIENGMEPITDGPVLSPFLKIVSKAIDEDPISLKAKVRHYLENNTSIDSPLRAYLTNDNSINLELIVLMNVLQTPIYILKPPKYSLTPSPATEQFSSVNRNPAILIIHEGGDYILANQDEYDFDESGRRENAYLLDEKSPSTSIGKAASQSSIRLGRFSLPSFPRLGSFSAGLFSGAPPTPQQLFNQILRKLERQQTELSRASEQWIDIARNEPLQYQNFLLQVQASQYRLIQQKQALFSIFSKWTETGSVKERKSNTDFFKNWLKNQWAFFSIEIIRKTIENNTMGLLDISKDNFQEHVEVVSAAIKDIKALKEAELHLMSNFFPESGPGSFFQVDEAANVNAEIVSWEDKVLLIDAKSGPLIEVKDESASEIAEIYGLDASTPGVDKIIKLHKENIHLAQNIEIFCQKSTNLREKINTLHIITCSMILQKKFLHFIEDKMTIFLIQSSLDFRNRDANSSRNYKVNRELTDALESCLAVLDQVREKWVALVERERNSNALLNVLKKVMNRSIPIEIKEFLQKASSNVLVMLDTLEKNLEITSDGSYNLASMLEFPSFQA